MKYCTLVVITSAGNPWLNEVPDLRSIGIAMKELARSRNGECLAWFNAGILTIAIQGLPPAEVGELLSTWEGSLQKNGTAVKITQIDSHPLPEGKTLTASFGYGSVIRERLTRRLLTSLPEGAYVISNVFSTETGRPIFAERLESAQSRSSAWKRATTAGAAGRVCLIVWAEEDFNKEVNRTTPEGGGR